MSLHLPAESLRRGKKPNAAEVNRRHNTDTEEKLEH